MAHDASHYLLVPEAVVTARDGLHVAALLRATAAMGIGLTFRSGGTSLSGQASTSGLLVDTRRNFRQVEVLDEGHRVRVQPGATVRQVNARLAPHRRKLGPDPASESACTIGGVIANNSSGMACGTEHNSYETLDSLVLVLASGSVIDTSKADADAQLRELEPDLHAGLVQLRDRVRGNAESVRTIRRLFAMKNTMGYGINAFLDHSTPVDMLAHLVVGSEGTLAFVAEATFNTVPRYSHAATGLLLFTDLRAATACLPELLATGPATVELLDAASLRVAQLDPLADPALRTLSVQDTAALLVEYQEAEPASLGRRVRAAEQAAAPLSRLLASPRFTRDEVLRANLWHIRKGLYAAVAGARPSGTTALLEDIAVPVPRLAETCEHLLALFERHRYEQSVIFGHAKDGNIHFLLNERFDSPRLLSRYVDFTAELVDLVLGEGGTLKAEHGTGRMMAPFVRRQYGQELYDVMRLVKQLCDPKGVLNPGILIDDDPAGHVTNLKTTPTVEPEVDRCVECGYCEPVCPSQDLTLTPRQRIVLRREIVRARTSGDHALVAELESDYVYDAVQTCAVDGMCETACPVLINTGDLVRRLRGEAQGAVAQAVWRSAARHWDAGSQLAARALDVAAALPAPVAERTSALARRILAEEAVPLWQADLPAGGTRRHVVTQVEPAAVLFSSCTGTMFAPAAGHQGVRAALLVLAARAGSPLAAPTSAARLCCGTPWKSKGLNRGYAEMRDLVLPSLLESTANGKLPIVSDAASCTEGLIELVRSGGAPYAQLQIVDAVSFTSQVLLPRLTICDPLPSLSIHPTCSSTRLGISADVMTVAHAAADRVAVPADWGCCAFAGDRGMLHPELTAAATSRQAEQVRAAASSAHASVNRTCEIGMTRATGQTYVHVLELLERVTRPSGEPAR